MTLTSSQLAATVDSLARAQRPDGLVPWYPGGGADPWNHVEAAMALSVGGRWPEARRAYRWLAGAQGADGAWCSAYHEGVAVDRRLDTNHSAYVAVGAWQHYLVTADYGFLEAMFPVVEAAVGFVIALQQAGGEVLWSLEPDGSPGRFALLTASSSVYLSLRCAVAAAERLGRPRPEWEMAAGRLAHAVAHRPELFLPKDRWAMDWYYPVLCGAVGGEEARARLHEGWAVFVMDGLGVRCVSDRPWATAAETAECALAFHAGGLEEEARLLLSWAHHLRHEDGSYWTGCVYPEGVHYPGGERSTYSAAAVVLADHALHGAGPAARLFSGDGLPRGLDLAEPAVVSEAGTDPPQHP